MSTEATTAEVTFEERAVEAIKQCHRMVRAVLVDSLGMTRTIDLYEIGRLEAALEILSILRPQMSREQVLAAAWRRIREAGEAS